MSSTISLLLPSVTPSPSTSEPSSVTLPPTTNCLGPSQQARLLRSTRKLGDMLGATPFLLESSSDAIYGEEFANIVRDECEGAFTSLPSGDSPSDAQFMSLVPDSQRNSFLNSTFTTLLAPTTPSQLTNKPSITVLTLPTGEKLLPPSPTGARVPPTPRTRKSRRQGQCFHSPSSSVTSVEDDDLSRKAPLYTSDDDYVFISSNNPPASRYHYHSLAIDGKPNFDRSTKPVTLFGPPTVKSRKSKPHLAPITMTFEVDVPPTSGLKSAKSTRSLKHKSSKQQLTLKSPKSRSKSKSISQQLPQPLLIRLPSVPPPHSHQGQTYPVPVSPPTSPLSPRSPTFSNSYPPMSSSNKLADRNGHKASEQARRKKMAKLTRTLGENIPPELVFGPEPPHSAIPARSLSLSRPRATTVSKAVDTLVEKAPPVPSTDAIVPLTTKGIKRAHRPRSLTLGTVSSQRGHTVAMSVDRPAVLAAPIPVVTPPKPPRQNAPPPALDRAFGKRRERGWSGEWNKDMDHVVKALRGLKAR